MGLVEGARRGFSVLALSVGACFTASCVSTGPSSGEDWRTLRRIDLPAELVRVSWSDEFYLSEGHPMQVGRTAVRMQPSNVARTFKVAATSNGFDGLFIDNLTCYNAARGEGKCALLLNRPDRCYLFVDVGSGASEKESFDVDCPARLTLGK